MRAASVMPWPRDPDGQFADAVVATRAFVQLDGHIHGVEMVHGGGKSAFDRYARQRSQAYKAKPNARAHWLLLVFCFLPVPEDTDQSGPNQF